MTDRATDRSTVARAMSRAKANVHTSRRQMNYSVSMSKLSVLHAGISIQEATKVAQGTRDGITIRQTDRIRDMLVRAL